MVAKHSRIFLCARQGKTNDGGTSFTVGGVSEVLIKHAWHAAICLGASASTPRNNKADARRAGSSDSGCARRAPSCCDRQLFHCTSRVKTRAHAPVRYSFRTWTRGAGMNYSRDFFFSLAKSGERSIPKLLTRNISTLPQLLT